MPDISKVILNGVTQMDVTQDTVAPGNLLLNETATMNNGTRTMGTVDLSTYALKAMLAPVEATTTSSTVYNVGDYLICQNNLRVATEPIGVNQTIDNSNSQVVLMADELRNAFIALEWSLGAAGYEPTGYATTGWANGDRILCGGTQPGLYEVYDISVGDYIPSGPDVISIDVMNLIDGLRTSKADKVSPTFGGTPTAPTAAAGTNTTQIATTAFVQGELSAHGLDTNGVEIPSTDNLDSYQTTGWYYWKGTAPSNTPNTLPYCSMYVDHAYANIKQTVYRAVGGTNTPATEWVRYKYSTGTWTTWVESPQGLSLVSLYYNSSGPTNVTSDVTVTLSDDMRNYKLIELYVTTSSTNASGPRSQILVEPRTLTAAFWYPFTNNGTNFYGVRLGLVNSSTFTQLRFVSTTASALYLVQILGVR